MSISNQTEVCYLRSNSVNDILICRGDFCLSKIGEGDVGDISSCGTTVLESISNEEATNSSPLHITLVTAAGIIMFIIIILCIWIMKKSKNRNNNDNYFASSSRHDQSFSQIDTDKYVEKAIRETIRDRYRAAKYPAYDKQLFILESNIRGNHLIFRRSYHLRVAHRGTIFINQCRKESDPTQNNLSLIDLGRSRDTISESFHVGSDSFRYWFQNIMAWI